MQLTSTFLTYISSNFSHLNWMKGLSLSFSSMLQLIIQEHSQSTLIDQNNTDAEKLKKELNIVPIQTEFDFYSDTEVPPKRGLFSNPQNFSNQPAAPYSSLKLHAIDEFSSVQIDTYHGNYTKSWLYLIRRCDSSPSRSFCDNDKKIYWSNWIVFYGTPSELALFTKKQTREKNICDLSWENKMITKPNLPL